MGIPVSSRPLQTLILKEAGGLLTSSVCQQAMLCVVVLRWPRGPDAETFGLGGQGPGS